MGTADDTSLAIESEEQGRRDAWLNDLITLNFPSTGHDIELCELAAERRQATAAKRTTKGEKKEKKNDSR